MTNEPRDAETYPELTEALMGENQESAPELLRATAEQILLEAGQESTINSLPAVVAPYFHTKELGGREFYVKIGQLTNPPKGYELPMILFAKDMSLAVNTPNPTALRFAEFSDETCLVTGNEADGVMPDPLLDDDRYVRLAEEALDDISSQHTETMQRRKHQDRERGEARRFVMWSGAVLLASVAAMYSHVPFGNEDAKIGPVPLPLPAEVAVDANNMPDHKAQGFEEPVEATDIAVGDIDVHMPLLDDYDSSGVPDAAFKDAMEGGLTEESRPGLYRVDFTSDHGDVDDGEKSPNVDEESFGRGCLVVHGDFREGQTQVFTQDVATAEKVHIDVKTVDELEMCLDAAEEEDTEAFKGSFYVWQED